MKHLIVSFTVITLLLSVIPTSFACNEGSGITEITMETTSSWFGLQDKFVLRSDGTATLVLPKPASVATDREIYHGNFFDFDRLAASLEMQGFFSLSDKYLAEEYDANSVVISAVRQGRRKEVMNYGDKGPVNLWAIEHIIRGAVTGIKWKKQKINSQ